MVALIPDGAFAQTADCAKRMVALRTRRENDADRRIPRKCPETIGIFLSVFSSDRALFAPSFTRI
jgi:hypothetical protein